MKPKDDIESWLMIWASFARRSEDVGWYSQQPWYTTSHLVWPNEPQALNELDREMAYRVEKMVEKLALRDPDSYTIIRQFYGAYAGAHPDRSARVQQLIDKGIRKREIYQTVRDAKRIIEGAVVYA